MPAAAEADLKCYGTLDLRLQGAGYGSEDRGSIGRVISRRPWGFPAKSAKRQEPEGEVLLQISSDISAAPMQQYCNFQLVK